ncbi:MAG: hypothetical protein IPF42_10380 [Candidatus Microthrix sp.]|nr:hypothetical protein [Candidatus Microthrix sp.]
MLQVSVDEARAELNKLIEQELLEEEGARVARNTWLHRYEQPGDQAE